jgi:hypothetical protein
MGIKSGFISAIKVIAVNHFTKEGGLFEFDSNDITENLIKSRMRCHHHINATFCQFD